MINERAADEAETVVVEKHASAAYLSMLWGALAFAAMGALGHLAGERCSWQLVALARSSLALVFSLVFALVAGVRLVFLRPRTLWVRSIFGSIGILCSFYSLTHLPISTSLTLSNTVPIWVTLLAWPILGYRPTRGIWLAIAAGLAGVVLIQRPYFEAGNLAGLAALAHALSWAIGMLGLNRLGKVDPLAVVVHFAVVSSVVCLLFFVLTGQSVSYDSLNDKTLMAMLAGVGITGTIGQLGQTRAFALGHPSMVAVVGLTQIVFACFFDLVVWKHRFDFWTVCGILLVMAPTAWLLLHSPLRRNESIHSTT